MLSRDAKRFRSVQAAASRALDWSAASTSENCEMTQPTNQHKVQGIGTTNAAVKTNTSDRHK